MKDFAKTNKGILLGMRTMSWFSSEGLEGWITITNLDFKIRANIIKILESFGGKWESKSETFFFKVDVRKDIAKFLKELDKNINIDLEEWYKIKN